MLDVMPCAEDVILAAGDTIRNCGYHFWRHAKIDLLRPTLFGKLASAALGLTSRDTQRISLLPL